MMSKSPTAKCTAGPMDSTHQSTPSSTVAAASAPAPAPTVHPIGPSAKPAGNLGNAAISKSIPVSNASAPQPPPIIKKMVLGSDEFKAWMQRKAAKRAQAMTQATEKCNITGSTESVQAATSRCSPTLPANNSSTAPSGSATYARAVGYYERNYIPSGLGHWESLRISACFDGVKTTAKLADPTRMGPPFEWVGKGSRTFLESLATGRRPSKRPSAVEVQQNGLPTWRWKESKEERLMEGNTQTQCPTEASGTPAPKMTLDEIIKLPPRQRRPTTVIAPRESQACAPPNPTPSKYRHHGSQAPVNIYRPEVNSYRRPAGDCYRPSYARSTASSRARGVSASNENPPSVFPREERVTQKDQALQLPRSHGMGSPTNTKCPDISREQLGKGASPPFSSGSASSSNASTKAQVTGGSALDNELAMLPPALQAKVANPFLETASSGIKRGRPMDEVEGNGAASRIISNKSGPSKKRAKIASNKDDVPKKAAPLKKAASSKKAAAKEMVSNETPVVKRARPDGEGKFERKRPRGDWDDCAGEEDTKSCKRQKRPQSKSPRESGGKSDMDDFVVHDTPRVRRRRKNSGGAARKFVKG